jgi:hypothetical protein
MFKQVSLGLVAIVASLNTHASVLTFSDRAAFEAAVGAYTVDNLDDLTDGPFTSRNRSDYTININSFGCNSGPGQCGDNSAQGFVYPAYVWTYAGGSFQFNVAINAFGLDFGHYSSSNAAVTLNGEPYARTGGGFFGIIDTDNTFTTVTYDTNGSGSLFDNVTYGVSGAEVPEPSSLALLAIAMAGMGARRRRTR